MADYSPLRREHLRQHVERQWSRWLTATERSVLFFVFDRTVGWGKQFERITASHMVDGIGGHKGLDISLRTATAALHRLVTRAVLTRIDGKNGHAYSINWEWMPEMGLAQPKKQRQQGFGMATPKAKSGEGVSNICIPPYAEFADPLKKGTLKNGTEERLAVATPRASVEQAISETIAAAARSRVRTEAKAAARPRQTDPQRLWQAAWRETFPEVPCVPWTRKVQGQCKHLFTAFGPQAPDMFDWAVRSWGLIRNTVFAWMKENPPPETPTVGFMLTFKDHLVRAWGRKDRLQQELKLTTEQRAVARLTREGMDHEAAVAEAEARTEVARDRQRLTSLKQEIANLERTRDRQQTEAIRKPVEARQRRAPAPNAFDEGAELPSLPKEDF